MAGTYNIKGDVLAQGTNLKVRADLNDDAGSNPVVIGFVQDANISKSTSIQRAEVLGEILPVSLDPTSVQTTITLRGFIPSKQVLQEGIDTVRGGGKVHLKSFNFDDSNLLDMKVATKIPYIDLWDEKHKSIIGSSSFLVVTGYRDSSSGKGYLMADITMEGIGYDNGPDYKG
ncbi:MAG: hypothetical protein LBT33_08200 [Spirochaetia bacterium]|jgi:hypothetical protein|nr:hypothetical protein [Spirochaetia bacterium]